MGEDRGNRREVMMDKPRLLSDEKISRYLLTPSKPENKPIISWARHIAKAQHDLDCQYYEGKIRELIQAYDEYLGVLGEEIDSLIGTAFVHGWKSTRIKQGEECREKIKSLKEEYLD